MSCFIVRSEIRKDKGVVVVKRIYDVIVAGAGPGGMTAALSAARNGMKVLLIDRNGCPGGMNTSGMVCPLMTFHAGEKQVVKGLAQEIVDRLAKRGATLGHIPDPIGMVSTITPIDPEMLKLVYFEMLAEEPNIKTLLYTVLESAQCEDGVVKSVTVLNKSGKTVYQAKTFIDATGDGDLAVACGADCVLGRSRDGMTQPMTLMFTVGGVNLPETVDYVEKNPEQFILNKKCDLRKYLAVSGFFNLVTEAQEKGELTLPRDRVLFFQGVHEGEVLVNMTRVTKLSGVNAKDLTAAEFEAHKQVDEILRFFQNYIPGFQNCYLRVVASVTGVRESRRIVGIETLELDDVLNNAVSDRSVAVCAWPVDIHDPVGNELNWMRKAKACCYDIPYGVMVPKKLKNLLATGRCISATHEALASARISATAMALGEAAGAAAAIGVKNSQSLAQVDVGELQKKLLAQGAVPGKSWL
nr:FAD-dependent oxidoreductase [Diplocloster modestus]